MRIRSALVAVLFAAACLFVLSCSDDNPVEPEPEILTSFSIEAPVNVTPGEPFTLSVMAVGSAGTKPFASFDGVVFWAASGGTVTPDSLVMTDGAGSGQVMLSGSGSSRTITASSGNITGSVVINAELMSALEGTDDDPASEAIPGFAFIADGGDYSSGHPSLPGALVSHNIIMVAFAPGTTVGQANTIIADIDARIVGGVPGMSGEATGVLFLKLSTSTHAEAEAVIADLQANPAVADAVQDILIGANAIPGSNDDNPQFWTWETTPVGNNWGLERIRVPQMWNFNAAVDKKLATQAFPPRRS